MLFENSMARHKHGWLLCIVQLWDQSSDAFSSFVKITAIEDVVVNETNVLPRSMQNEIFYE